MERFDTTIVIKGRRRADQLHGSLVSDALGTADPPESAGSGWWLVRGEWPLLLPYSSTEVLASGPAVVAHGVKESICRFLLFEEGTDAVELLAGDVLDGMDEAPRAERSAIFESWAKRHAPAHPTESATRLMWAQMGEAPGSELMAWVLTRLGWALSPTRPSRPELDGCNRILDRHGPSWVGETNVRSEQVRFVMGTGDGFVGIWDRLSGGGPTETFSDDVEGIEAARRRQFELVDAVILRSTELDGKRWGAPIDPAPGHRGAPACILHWSSRGAVSLIVTSDPPRTWICRDENGVLRLSKDQAEALGIEVRRGVPTTLPIEDDETVIRFADLYVRSRRLGPWTPIPADVPRGLLETARWLNQRY